MRETVGGYKIVEWVGVTGIGEVFRARDTRNGRTVTLRLVDSEISGNPNLKEPFLADAKTASGLSHPNIATIYEAGEDDDALFVASEFVPGQTLSQAIARRGLNLRRAVDYAIQIADALADAHALDVIHGRLTSADIVVTPKGTLKLLDFGLAGWTSGGRHHERRDDLQSLADVIFEMITGKRLADGDGTSAPPGTRGQAMPRDLDAIIGRLLTDDENRKYGSPATVAAELRAVAETMSDRNQPDGAPVVIRESRAGSIRWAAVALTGIAIALAIAWLVSRP